jgi:hypothetical protein
VIVRDSGRGVGIVTDRDLAIRVLGKGLDPNATTLAEVMTTNVVTLAPSDTQASAIRRMQKRNVRAHPPRGGRPLRWHRDARRSATRRGGAHREAGGDRSGATRRRRSGGHGQVDVEKAKHRACRSDLRPSLVAVGATVAQSISAGQVKDVQAQLPEALRDVFSRSPSSQAS